MNDEEFTAEFIRQGFPLRLAEPAPAGFIVRLHREGIPIKLGGPEHALIERQFRFRKYKGDH